MWVYTSDRQPTDHGEYYVRTTIGGECYATYDGSWHVFETDYEVRMWLDPIHAKC